MAADQEEAMDHDIITEGKNHIFLLLAVEPLRDEMGGVLVRD